MITMRDILRGAVGRVLPGFLVGWALLVASSSHSRSLVTPGRIALSVLMAGAAALGSTIALSVMRRRLRSDAGVGGRRAFLVGLGTVGITITVRPFLSGIGAAGEYGLVTLSAAALATAMFVPWLSRRPADERVGVDTDRL
jgi:hypothetical protein